MSGNTLVGLPDGPMIPGHAMALPEFRCSEPKGAKSRNQHSIDAQRPTGFAKLLGLTRMLQHIAHQHQEHLPGSISGLAVVSTPHLGKCPKMVPVANIIIHRASSRHEIDCAIKPLFGQFLHGEQAGKHRMGVCPHIYTIHLGLLLLGYDHSIWGMYAGPAPNALSATWRRKLCQKGEPFRGFCHLLLIVLRQCFLETTVVSDSSMRKKHCT